nr:receptor-like protein 12 [Quercus suber]
MNSLAFTRVRLRAALNRRGEGEWVVVANPENLKFMDVAHFNDQIYALCDNGKLGETKFWGEIPRELGRLPQLHSLIPDSNKLSEQIPSALGNLSLFKHNLSKNLLTGEIPQSLGSLVQLEELDLSENKLTGNIPKELGNCGRLLSLDLSNNNLLVEIPSELGQISTSKVLEEATANAYLRNSGKFTFGDLVKATEDFNEKYCIGKGGFGTVYRAALSTDR